MVENILQWQHADGSAWHRGRVVFMGHGEAGKTSLCRALQGLPVAAHEAPTEGIAVSEWQVSTAEGTEIAAPLWDFSGQEIAHATHTLFISPHSLYVVVIDQRRKDTLAYWLNQVKTVAGSGAPVLVVMSKTDEDEFELDRAGLYERFPQIKNFYKVSAFAGEGIDALRKGIASGLAEMPVTTASLPATWGAVGRALAQESAPYTSWQEYATLCRTHGVEAPEAQEALAGVLCGLGVVFWSAKAREKLVLNPAWLRQGIYAIMLAAPPHVTEGSISAKGIDTVLSEKAASFDYPVEAQEYLMRVLEAFDLSYATAQATWLVPGLLPAAMPQEIPSSYDGLGVYYQYEFLPRGLFGKLLKLLRQLRATGREPALTPWRYGVLLEYSQHSQVVVTLNYERGRLTCWAYGQERQKGLETIRNILAACHQRFSHLMPQLHLYVPGYGNTAAIAYHELVEAQELGQTAFKVPGHKATVNVVRLLEEMGLTPEDSRAAGPLPPTYLQGFHITGFLGIQDAAVAWPGEQPQWIMLTGLNGIGKTTLLQALAFGLADAAGEATHFLNGEDYIPRATVALDYRQGANPQQVTRNGRVQGRGPVGRALVAYGSARLNIHTRVEVDADEHIRSLFDTTVPLRSIERQLIAWHEDGSPEAHRRLNKVKELFVQLLPQIGEFKIQKAGQDKAVYWYEEDLEGARLTEGMRYHELAAGYKNVIAFVGDMLVWLFEAQPEAQTPEALKGIVLIDELELHLHPQWQRLLPRILSKAMPQVQFVASTHSPMPLLGAPAGSVFLTVHRSKGAGITVERLADIEEDIRFLMPNTLLSSPIFAATNVFQNDYDRKADGMPNDKIYNAYLFEEWLKERRQKREPLSEAQIEELRDLFKLS